MYLMIKCDGNGIRTHGQNTSVPMASAPIHSATGTTHLELTRIQHKGFVCLFIAHAHTCRQHYQLF